ncbi:MAG TPA: hypothetical protein VGO52_18700 [Hyphomonadaceae bacterium]|jgi:hypothetical protein|nr:hypothetical protein [Hyphomonadaceae bacterium]
MGTQNFQPFRRLELGAELFVRGLPRAFVLAIACAALQLLIVPALTRVLFDFRGPLAIIGAAANLSALLFFHVWFVLFMTGWHLRGATARTQKAIAIRSLAFAIPVTAVLMLIPYGFLLASENLQVGYSLDDPGTGDMAFAGGVVTYSQQASGFVMFGRQLWSAIWIVVWAAAILSDLPALVMAGPRQEPEPVWRRWLLRLIAMAPWLLLALALGWPSQTCTGECWGLFEGGIVMIPIFGAYLFVLSTSCAALSAASRLPPRPEMPLDVPPMHPFRR